MRRWLPIIALLFLAATAEETKLLRIADTAFEDRLYDFAERQYTAFLTQFPGSDQAGTVRSHLAQAQLGQFKWREALATIAPGLAQPGPAGLEFRFWQAEALAMGEDYPAAEPEYVAVITAKPDGAILADAQYGLAYVRFKLGRYAEAATALATVKPPKTRPQLDRQVALLSGQILLAQGRLDQAEELLAQFYATHQASRWGFRALRWRAELAVRQGDSDLAVERYQTVIDAYTAKPNQPVDAQLAAEAAAGLGWVRWNAQDYPAAIESFSQASQLATEPWLQREAIVKLAESYVRAGKLAQGVARLKDFLKDHPRDPLAEEVQLSIGDLFYAAQDYGAALAEYQELIARYPASELVARTSYQAGWCAVRQQHLVEGLTFFRQAFARASNVEGPGADTELAAEALCKVADLEFETGALAEAVGSYQRLISSYPQSGLLEQSLFQLGQVYGRLQNAGAAVQTYESLVERFPQGEWAPQALFQIAVIQIGLGEEEAARQTFQRVETMFPSTAWAQKAQLARGESFYREGTYAAAIKEFDELIAAAPDTEPAQHALKNRGWCFYALGEPEKTLVEFTRFIETYPDSALAPSLQFWIGDYYARQKDYIKAQEQFQAIHKRYPNSDMADAGLYFAGRAAYARQDYKNTIELYESLIKTYTNSSFRCAARFGQGDAFTEMNQFEDALLVFDSLIKQFADCSQLCEAQGRRGDCLYTLKRYDEAIAGYRAALTCARDGAATLRNQIRYKIGQSQEKAGYLDEALEQYTQVVYETVAWPDPAVPPERFWLSKAGLAAGTIREQQQDWRGAITVYERLSQLCPDLKDLLEERIRRIRVEHFILF